MLLTKGQKLKKYFSAFVVGVVFLFVLSAQNALATSSVDVYNKPVNGTLESAEWNGLLTDFVNTWLPATMVGPLGIGTSSQVGKLNVEGAGTYSAIFTNGSVGIGLTNPSQMLHVNGAGQFDQFVYGITPVNVPAYKMALATVEYVNSALATSTQNILDAGFWKLSGDNLFASSTSWKLGIGTTSPSEKLEIYNGKTKITFNTPYDNNQNNGALVINNTNGLGAALGVTSDGNLRIKTSSLNVVTPSGEIWFGRFGMNSIQAYNTDFAIFTAGDVERFRINKITGNVGIGTTAPGSKLEIKVDSSSQINNALKLSNTQGKAGIGTGIVFYSDTVPTQGVFNSGRIFSYNPSYLWSTAKLIFQTPTGSDTWVDAMTLQNGNVGIGTTTPAQLLHVAGQAQFDNLAFGVTPVNSLANKLALATVEYVNGYVSTATSTLASTTIGKFVGATPDTYNGSNNGHPGYAYANNQCATTPSMLGSHVCTTAEILNTILLANNTLPSEDVWIFSGPPGFTAMANDCIARTSVNNDANTFGAIWQGKTVQYPEGRGLLKHCHETAKIACCK